jgi:hypothetical protein
MGWGNVWSVLNSFVPEWEGLDWGGRVRGEEECDMHAIKVMEKLPCLHLHLF